MNAVSFILKNDNFVHWGKKPKTNGQRMNTELKIALI